MNVPRLSQSEGPSGSQDDNLRKLQALMETMLLPPTYLQAVTEMTRLLGEHCHDPSRVVRRMLTYIEDSIVIQESEFDMDASIDYAFKLDAIL